jgi:hypothetical protein
MLSMCLAPLNESNGECVRVRPDGRVGWRLAHRDSLIGDACQKLNAEKHRSPWFDHTRIAAAT